MVERAVFINYRGEDSANTGAWLYTELTHRFGDNHVFLDAESIPAGADFVEELLRRVRSAHILLAVIGPDWLTATDPTTERRRIDDPLDWVHRELAEAFAVGVRVIPVLTDHAELPDQTDLPADIAALSRCQYRHLSRREPKAGLARIVTDLTTLDPVLAAAARDNPPPLPLTEPLTPTGSMNDQVIITMGTRTRRWWATRASPTTAHNGLSDMDDWTEGLAWGVRTLWRREEAHRRVHDPVTLPIRWHPAAAELADHWTNVRRAMVGASAQPVDIAGRIEHLAQLYRSIPSGRLVILGAAGGGKTVLASRLALDLLAARRPGQPVPVIVTAGSWNPASTPLNVWLASQLARDHPGLAPRVGAGGPTRIAALINSGRVLPILDGFDELDPGLHRAALHQLNTTPDAPIVITSRVPEYTTAVRDTDVLTAAAVIELDDLSMDDLAGYLPRTAAGSRTGIWSPVVERMRTQPHAQGPATLRQVLTNPLMVFLARTIYSDLPGPDPVELLDTQRFPTAQAVQEHLLTAFVPAVYHADQPANTRRWTVEHAHRYLTYLADHLHRLGTRDVAWWQLCEATPRRHRILIFALVDGLIVGTTFGLAAGLTFGRMAGLTDGGLAGLAATLANILTITLTTRLSSQREQGKPGVLSHRLTIGLVVGLVIGPVVGLAAGFAIGPVDRLTDGLVFGLGAALTAGLLAVLVGRRRPTVDLRPTRTRLHVRGRARFISGRFVAGSLVGFVLVAVFVSGLVSGPVAGLTAALVAGLAVGLAAAIVFGLEAPADAADVISATESLTRDRRNALRKLLVAGLVAGLTYSFTSTLSDGLVFGLATTVVVGIVAVRATSAWIYWLVLVRGWLPLTGRLPWRIHTFLTDAYQRGVLRQTGAVYQFRHARLQDHAAHRPTTRQSIIHSGR